MSKHTPGPYTAEAEPDPEDGCIAIIADGDKNPTRGLVGVATWRTAETEEAALAEQRANADLFAAAPKTVAERDRLREALERVAATKAGGPHIGAKEGMAAALEALYSAHNIARTALSGTAPSEADKLRAELAEAGSEVAGLVTERESLLRSVDRLREINGELVKALEGVLAFEQARATDLHGLSDCGCMAYSRASESAYENHECPHQKARAALAKAREAQP